MTEKKSGWKMPRDPAKFTEEYNKKAFLSNFPPDKRWQKVEGILVQDRPDQGDTLVSISGRDHKGEEARFWVDLPNAMYLFAMLRQFQHEARADVPLEQPGTTKPHPST
jgi:hypothetical protein